MFLKIRRFSLNLVALKGRNNILKPSSRPNLLESLSSGDKEKKVEKESEKLQAPQNVKDSFYRKYDLLSRNLSGDKSVYLPEREAFPLIMELIKDLNTPEELEMSQEVLEMWRRAGRLFSRSQSVILLDTLLKENLADAMFELMCNKYLFGLKPDAGHIFRLLRHYATLSLSDKENHIRNLDMAYKCFALFLYYDIPPPKDSYHFLIVSGLYGETEEGIARSILSEKERDALGWESLPETDYAWAHYYLSTKNYGKVSERLKGIDTVQSLIFKATAVFRMGHLLQAKEIAAKLDTMEQGENSVYEIGKEMWVSRQDLDKLLHDRA